MTLTLNSEKTNEEDTRVDEGVQNPDFETTCVVVTLRVGGHLSVWIWEDFFEEELREQK